MRILKTLAITTPLAISALALSSCNKNEKQFDTKSMPIEQEYENKISSSDSIQQEKPDGKKPNLPKHIASDVIQYKNLSGELVNVKIVDNATISLYSAIQKHSTADSPEITDIGGFYADVEANINKAQKDKSDGQTIDQSMLKQSSQNIVALRHLQCSTMFNKLFDIFTSPKSEGGENITVNEYTKMMDAWSSTGTK